MAIEKNTKNTLQHEDFPFTIINNDVINKIQHTGALGVYCYLSSKSSGWEICKKQLQNHFGCGREHIETCFKYLKKIGAIEISMIRDEKGKSIGWNTLLKRKLPEDTQDDIQNTENPLSGDLSRIREIQNLGNPESGKSAPINKRYIENKDNNKYIGDFEKSPNENYTSQDSDILNPESKEKSDYLNTHDVAQNDGHIARFTEEEEVKSDYFEYQPNIEQSVKSKQQKAIKDYNKDERFMRFYNAYPKKVDPRDAHKAFKQVVGDNDDLLESILSDIENRKANHSQWSERQYIKHPATYLRKGEYLGEVVNNNHENQKQQEANKLAAEKRQQELEAHSRKVYVQEQLAEKRKQQEIQDSKKLNQIVSKASEESRKRLRDLLGARDPGGIYANG